MKERLHILLIDDNADDRALAVLELRRAFPNLRALEVADLPSFHRVLQSASCDLVITDYQLRWTDGLAVLRQVKARWPECPVVMFTGTGNEEIAVTAMKAGVDDYVLKSPEHYARLPAVVRFTLRVARQKQQLQQAEARYAGLFASVPIGLYRSTAEGRILDANPACIAMLGFPDQKTLLDWTLADLHADPATYQNWQGLMAQHGVVCRYITRLRTYDGQDCWVENSARSMREPRTGWFVYEGSLVNISERKQAEDERERLILDLQQALAQVKTLSGLLPICAACKKIRDDNGYWKQIEEYIQTHSDAEFTHSFCPDCMRTIYADLFENDPQPRL